MVIEFKRVKMADAEVLSSIESSPPSRRRIIELSRPKQTRSIWITSAGPRVMWGTQETLRPISEKALSANPNPRVEELSQPKKNFQNNDKTNRDLYYYSAGRPSEVWDVNPQALEAEATARLKELGRHKEHPRHPLHDQCRPHFAFSCGRSSPIWDAPADDGEGTGGPDMNRLEDLSKCKPLHKEYAANRPVAQTIIPKAALTTKSTDRQESLAAARNRQEGPFRQPMWPVTGPAKKASPTTRVQELSKFKSIADGYMYARECVWEIPKSARRAVATSRVSELAAPIVRASMDNVQFDPNAFLVKQAALKGKCSNRIEDLSKPIQR